MNAFLTMPIREQGMLFTPLFSLIAACCLAVCTVSAQDRFETSKGELVIHPVHHASFVMEWNKLVIHVDPVGNATLFTAFPKPDVILITHSHSDHLDSKTLEGLVKPGTRIVAPVAAAQLLPRPLRKQTVTLENGVTNTAGQFPIESIAAYNITDSRLRFHPKGQGNGYVLTLGDKRIYISGDTEETPEMRALKDIDIAFICMNLPYTMDVTQAAKAVRAFHPKVVFPYHYRGSDLERFKQLLGSDTGAEVRIRDWYAGDASTSR